MDDDYFIPTNLIITDCVGRNQREVLNFAVWCFGKVVGWPYY